MCFGGGSIFELLSSSFQTFLHHHLIPFVKLPSSAPECSGIGFLSKASQEHDGKPNFQFERSKTALSMI
jgi:hypothetical protein